MPQSTESAPAGGPSVRYTRPPRLGGVELLAVRRSGQPWRFVDDALVAVHVVEGAGVWTCRGRSAPLEVPCVLVAGRWDVLILDRARQPLTFQACWIAPARVTAATAALGLALARGEGIPVERREPDVLAAFGALAAAMHEPAEGAGDDDVVVRALASLRDPPPSAAADGPPLVAETARRQIHAAYDVSPFGKTVPMPRLAAELRRGTVPLIREFKRAFGLPPYQYFVHVRLARARAFIQNGPTADRLTFADIATESGYFDLAQMGKAFHEILRVGPREYARQIGVYDRWRERRNTATTPRGRGSR